MKRTGRVFRILVFLLACVVTLVFLFYGFENWRGRRAWKHYKAEMESKGENLNPSSIIPQPVPDASNFAAIPLFTERFQTNETEAEKKPFEKLTGQFQKALREAEKRLVAGSNSFVISEVDLRTLFQALGSERPPGTIVPQVSTAGANVSRAKAAEGVLAELQAYDPIFTQIENAAARPLSRFPIDYEKWPFAVLLPHLSALRSSAQLLSTRANARLAAGKGDLALQDLKLIWRLADSIKGEPFLISYLVRVAILNLSFEPLAAGLSSGLWTQPQLEDLQNRLFEINLVREDKEALHDEIVFCGLNGIDYLRRAPSSGKEVLDPGVPWVARMLPNGWFYLEMIQYYQLAQQINSACNPDEKTIDPQTARRVESTIEREISNPPYELIFAHKFWSRMMLPALTRLTMRTAKMQAGLDLAGMACVLERYRLAHNEYPESLAAVKPLLDGREVRDVIGGGPLHYQRESPTDYILYSIGWNNQDDNGHVEFKHPKGGDDDLTEGDWAWRPIHLDVSQTRTSAVRRATVGANQGRASR